jgi:gluconolactonase
MLSRRQAVKAAAKTIASPKRNRLFMAASQSMYAVYVNSQGAGPA